MSLSLVMMVASLKADVLVGDPVWVAIATFLPYLLTKMGLPLLPVLVESRCLRI